MRAFWLNLIVLWTSCASAQTLIGPTPYLHADDSPFTGFAGHFIEDFEDLTLDPRISASIGMPVGPGGSTDSVDGDDGDIDGSGSLGSSFFAQDGQPGIRFTFDAALIGAAPTVAGLVWTDGSGLITFKAYDTQGVLIASVSASHAGFGASGQTDEDRFYGVEHAGGIGSISISNSKGGIEVDHVQFALIPAPPSLPFLGLVGLATARRRR